MEYLFGVAAGILYVLTVIIGGQKWQGYSIYQAISELTLRTSPHWKTISHSFVIFNLLLLLHGIVFMIHWVTQPWLLFSGLAIVIVALAGLVMVRFPMDKKPNNGPTRHGIIHRRMASVAIEGSVVIAISSTIGFGQASALQSLVWPSAVLSVAIASTAFGIWMSSLSHSPAFGSFQKATLGLFMIWLSWTAIALALIS